MRLIDLDDPDVVFCGHEGDYLRYNIWEEVPTVDAVPVVRCKDCRYNVQPPDKGFSQCELDALLREPEFWCKAGQRR